MKIQLEGELTHIKALSNKSAEGAKIYNSKEVWVWHGSDQYPQVNSINFAEKNFALLEGFNVGDKVVVTFYSQGSKYYDSKGVGNVFNKLTGISMFKKID